MLSPRPHAVSVCDGLERECKHGDYGDQAPNDRLLQGCTLAPELSRKAVTLPWFLQHEAVILHLKSVLFQLPTLERKHHRTVMANFSELSLITKSPRWHMCQGFATTDLESFSDFC